MKAPKKLIEVALPLKTINEACKREKNIHNGHPDSLHLWWARRPLAAARAVIFAQMVNDPLEKYGENPTPQQRSAATKERNRLFKIIEDLVQWENTNNDDVLGKAREKICESWRETCRLNAGDPNFDPEKLPAFHDPFAGGGALPLEAQRLGLESYASDLNPVAAMICKAMIEIPLKFAGRTPVGPIPEGEAFLAAKVSKRSKNGVSASSRTAEKAFWPGATGIAEDVRRYGLWMQDEARKRIGTHCPPVEITEEMARGRDDLKPLVGRKLTVISWLWARTVKSPNPLFSDVDIPLVRSFVLSKNENNSIWVEPIVEAAKHTYSFTVRISGTPALTKTVSKKGALCLMSKGPIELKYVREEAKAGRMGRRLFAIVADGPNGRVYLPPTKDVENALSENIQVGSVPRGKIDHWAGCTNCVVYGLDDFSMLFSDRQLLELTTFSDLIQEARAEAISAARKQGIGDGESLAEGGSGAIAYGDVLAVYLAFAVDKCSDHWSTMCTWDNTRETIGHTFGRQAIPMSWDYAEANPFSGATGSWDSMITGVSTALKNLPCTSHGSALQHDATQPFPNAKVPVISTDPPYYDNVPYSNISDYFYIWMRRNLRDVFPDMFATMAVPKAEELVANQFRHGGKENALSFFMGGMCRAFSTFSQEMHPAFPITIYYAFKATDKNVKRSNKGWESFLQSVLDSGFAVTGTWPMSTEAVNRRMAFGNNALESSIVLVCRRRPADALEITRRDFLRELKAKMPDAVKDMQGIDGDSTPVAPVDMAQAAVGPGMEIYSKYKAVLNADGSRMSVHDAIIEINRFLDDGDDFDAETQFCRDWFREHQWDEGPSGEADVLARAKGISVDSVVDAGVLLSRGGKTRLVHWQDYPDNYDPAQDAHRPVWEVCHHLVRIHHRRGTGAAGEFLSMVQGQGESARQLAYLLYTICERQGLTDDARAYNELATAWGDILAASIAGANPGMRQDELGL